MRQKIYDALKNLYPTYFIGMHNGKCKDPYLVIKFNDQSLSTANSQGAFQSFEVMVYIPGTSIKKMDSILDGVKNTLTNLAEFTGRITPDFYDEEVEAFMRSIQFKLVKEV